MIVRDVLDNGLRLLTESMPHVRSISIGVWLTRGSRHEPAEQSGIAHFVEHMLFKGTATRSAEEIAQEIDSIGGQLDAFTAKEYAELLHQGARRAPAARRRHPLRHRAEPGASPATTSSARRRSIVEEIKMVEDTPDDLVHELFTQAFWEGHPLGRPILGHAGDGRALHAGRVCATTSRASTPPRTS